VIPRPSGRFRAAVAALAAAAVLAACGPAGPSFDPAGPCVVDGQAEGAYPDLEAAIPATLRSERPTRLDSGRSCSAANLGTLAGHGVAELRFAGGLWSLGDRSGLTIVRFSAPGLQAAWMAEFYETGARAARKTEEIETTNFRIEGRDAWRLDTLNDESFQSIVVWPAVEPDAVWAVLAGNDVREIESREAHEAIIADAIGAVGS
jgi:hypothetical protein